MSLGECMQDNIAVLTDTSEFSLFKTVGAVIEFVDDEKRAFDKLRDFASKYKLIIISESLAKILHEEIKRYEKSVYPIILTLPNVRDNSGYAIKNLVRVAKEALGIDVFKEA